MRNHRHWAMFSKKTGGQDSREGGSRRRTRYAFLSFDGISPQDETCRTSGDVHAMPVVAAPAKDKAHVGEVLQRLHESDFGGRVVIALLAEHRSPLVRRQRRGQVRAAGPQ